jgi:hypothetical protein
MGRHSVYTPELAARICARLASGESLRAICADEDMPPESTVREWAVDDREGFAAQYARAREAQADFHADEIIEIADSAEDAQLGRLRVDARKWVASKLAPKRYGERLDVAHSGDVHLAMGNLDDKL